ncbi:chaplin [Streptomyces sp. NPDC096132]|uniref:chaplin n=1 Tax=Streptomyces sp. NPDC096132 TaxID=3366075 RepID=UPI0037FCD8C2
MKKSAAVVAGVILALGGAAAPAFADAEANGFTVNSGGFLSGNVVQVVNHMPINFCGNSTGAFSVLNPTFGNVCFNH